MADRPWVTPQEVKEYSEIKKIQERKDIRLTVDIARAEQYVMTYTHNTFEEYKEIPSSIKTAILILAEAYGYNAIIATKEVKSETFDDYSYTTESNAIQMEKLDLEALLNDYIKPKNRISMCIRKL